MNRDIPAPESSLPKERRGPVVGRFCKGCHSVYPRFAARHSGKPEYGRDHVGATCSYEGRAFEAGADWWEPAVLVEPVKAVDPAA
jgi:hypothetical protein